MNIAFYWTDGRAQPWIDGFERALPGVRFTPWQPGDPAADYAVVWSPPQGFFDEQPQLKAVFSMGAGVDALMKLDIPLQTAIVRLDDAGMSVQMAEYVCHAVIRHFREFDSYERNIREGKWSYLAPKNRADFPIGIMGLGVLGTRVAQALRGFDFPVNGWSRQPKSMDNALDGVRGFVGADQLDDFLAASKVLVCLMPLTPETQNILNYRNLSRLQPGGYVINVARGAHLVDDDLIALIDSGHLAGATLDVFRQEPLPPAHAFWRHPKITVTPHTSARTLREESIAQIARKITALEQGLPASALAGVVDRQRGY